jgi:GT2 family glycosyltransferase
VRSVETPVSDLVSATISLDRGELERRTNGEPVQLGEAFMYGAGAAVMVSRRLLTEIGGFKNELGAGRRYGGAEDLEFLWHLARHGPMLYRADVAVLHRDVTDVRDVGRKFRQYGRALGRLAACVGGREGARAVRGFCAFLLRTQLQAPEFGRRAARDRWRLRGQTLLAAVETMRPVTALNCPLARAAKTRGGLFALPLTDRGNSTEDSWGTR